MSKNDFFFFFVIHLNFFFFYCSVLAAPSAFHLKNDLYSLRRPSYNISITENEEELRKFCQNVW
jgi:hypothetical protein